MAKKPVRPFYNQLVAQVDMVMEIILATIEELELRMQQVERMVGLCDEWGNRLAPGAKEVGGRRRPDGSSPPDGKSEPVDYDGA
jgi:hypothetical protein